MLAPTVLLLAVGLVVVVAIIGTMLFTSVTGDANSLESSRSWTAPVARGDALKAWMRNLAWHITKEELKHASPATVATHAMQRLYRGLSRSLKNVGTFGETERPSPCPSEASATFGVTAVEALAIAEHMRHAASAAQCSHLAEVVKINATQPATSDLACPLLSADGICSAFELRPLHCRTCPTCGPNNRPKTQLGDQAMADELEAGLAEALNCAGLDGEVYELNSALNVALNAPHAADAWAKGEPVFAGCKKLTP